MALTELYILWKYILQTVLNYTESTWNYIFSWTTLKVPLYTILNYIKVLSDYGVKVSLFNEYLLIQALQWDVWSAVCNWNDHFHLLHRMEIRQAVRWTVWAVITPSPAPPWALAVRAAALTACRRCKTSPAPSCTTTTTAPLSLPRTTKRSQTHTENALQSFSFTMLV